MLASDTAQETQQLGQMSGPDEVGRGVLVTGVVIGEGVVVVLVGGAVYTYRVRAGLHAC